MNEEQRNVRNLIRVVAGFVAWPSLTISLAMMLEIDEHFLHIAGLLPLGLVALFFFFRARHFALKWVADENPEELAA